MGIKLEPNKLREKVVEMVFNAKSGHIGGSFSLAEICAYLYSNYSLISPEDKAKSIWSASVKYPDGLSDIGSWDK